MRRSAEFATTVRRGRRGSARALMVYVAPFAPPDAVAAGGRADTAVIRETDGAHEPDARVGFVVGRAVGPAVVRNRVRRRLRHLVAARLATLPAGVAVVVRAHPSAATLSSAELGRAFDGALATALAPARVPGRAPA